MQSLNPECISWGPTLRNNTQKEKLNTVTNLAVSQISNTRRSTPRATLQILYDIPPLDLIMKYEAIVLLSRNRKVIVKDWLGQNKQSRMLVGHIQYWERLAGNLGIDLESTDRIEMDMWGNKYTVNQESFLNTNKPIPAQISIYTDGSKTEDHVETGYVIYKQGVEIHTNSTMLPNKNTVYQAEVLAINLAVEKLLKVKEEKDRFVKKFSDSQAALKALNSWKIKSKFVFNTIASLNKLGEKVDRLELNWAKAHNNYTGNERADKMARNAVYNNIVFFGLDPPHSYFIKQLWNAIYELWNECW